RKTLSRLRQALGADPFAAGHETVAIKAGLVDCDAATFDALLRDGSPDALAAAVALYRGEFLRDVSIDDETWSDWLANERSRLEDLAVGAMASLAERELARGDPQ